MTQICIHTDIGDIFAEIYEEKAPRTAAHFLQYVDEGRYNGAGARFYRTVRSGDNQPVNPVQIDVIEGGFCNAYYADALCKCFDTREPFDEKKGPIAPRMIAVERTDETGLRHRDGTLTLGRTNKDAVDDSIVVCVGDNPHLDAGGRRHIDGYGFSAFGQVTQGMDVVRRIHQTSTDGQFITGGMEILSVERI